MTQIKKKDIAENGPLLHEISLVLVLLLDLSLISRDHIILLIAEIPDEIVLSHLPG